MSEYYQYYNVSGQDSCDTEEISHDGIIKKIDDKYYYVSIIAKSACVSCQVKGACNVNEIQEEIIEVPVETDRRYNVGDRVKLLMERSMGTKAVFLGYVLPFLLLLATLITSLNLFDDQGVAGLLAIGILVPYYLALYALRDKLKTGFVFRIR